MGRHSDHNHTGGPPGMRVPDGARVLVARSPDRAGELVTALRRVGAEPVLLPLIDFEQASDQHSLDVAFDALGAGAYTWLVISSVTTVQALEAKAAERGASLSSWLPGSILVATIGPATRGFLESRGISVDLAPTGQQSGTGLLDIWPANQGSVLLPQADIADPRLRKGLEARGASVQAVTAYNTVDYPADPRRALPAFPPGSAPTSPQSLPQGTGPAGQDAPPPTVLTVAEAKAEIGAGRLHAVVAASPSAARRIHADLAPLGNCRFVAIGRSTAAEADSLGLGVAAVAQEPTASGLVAAVVRSLDHDSPPHPSVAEPSAKDTI
ncbi:uroporphyrinogen-III synthase [Arthrobacter sp. ES3-54]|nr:uroporphyrinogen-III synthase [Arthrobacter sp. ES3-54]